jgi:hypothetical protein
MRFLLISISILLTIHVNGVYGQSETPTVTIGNLDGEEVIVHVYSKKDDPFPFIEFSVVADKSSDPPRVEITETVGKSTEGGFMIITGVAPTGEVGIVRSDRYEISFRRLSDYKVYEKAVMDYLRRLPVPETLDPAGIEVNLEKDLQDIGKENEEAVDLGDIVMDAVIAVGNDLSKAIEVDDDFTNISNELEQLDVFTLSDTMSAVVHVHRNEDDIAPFKEFVTTLYRDERGMKRARIVEVKGVKSGTRMIIMTGFEEKGEEGILQSLDYDVSSYNVEDSEIHEQAVIDFMKGLTTAQFEGSEATIGDDWERALAPEEKPVVKPVVVAPVAKGRKSRKKEMSQREINKIAKEVEQAKYKAPKHKSKYGKHKSGKMSSRMAKYNRKKVRCPSIRGH